MQSKVWNSGKSLAILNVLPRNFEQIISFYSLFFASKFTLMWLIQAANSEPCSFPRRHLMASPTGICATFSFIFLLTRTDFKGAALQRWLERYHLCPICLLILRYRASILSLVSHAPYIIRLIRRGRFKPEPGDRNLVPRSAGGRRRSWFTCLLTPALDVSPHSPLLSPTLPGDSTDPYSADDLNLLEPFKSTGFLLVMSAAVSDRPLTT